MGNHQKGYECFNILDKESNWSKAIYAYGKVRTRSVVTGATP